MKAGWKTVLMGELCSITSGESDTQDAVADGEYAFFDRSKTIKRSTRFLHDCEALIIPGEGKEFLPRHFNGKFDLHQRAYALFDFKPELDVRFLYYLLHHRSDYLPSVAVGATVKSLRRRHFEELPVTLPPLAEQKRIVALLDKAFAGIDEAKDRLTQEIDQVNSLLQSKFNEIFAQPPITFEETRISTTESTFSAKGRKATSRNIAGSLSLCVGKPSSPARSGWRWIELSSLAQLESGHTPSRAKQEYWNGNIPWISIRDAKKSHGKVITDTEECITDLGVENSSARILPTNTVCLSRTASVGYCTITGRPMATSQDFVNWVIKGDLHPSFLKFIFLAEGDQLLRFASGSVHQTIYYPETKAFAVCIPNLTEQVRIARHLEELTLVISQLRDKLANKQVHLGKLKSSMLAEAFAGELTA